MLGLVQAHTLSLMKIQKMVDRKVARAKSA
jgi:hypothetical protein